MTALAPAAGVLRVPAALAPVRWWADTAAAETRLARELPPGACRLFAATLARERLPVYAAEYPDDGRPAAAVAAATAYALGLASSAARSAAWSAASSAARSAAWSAAWSAAGSAAGSAAWSAAGSAQAKLLRLYLAPRGGSRWLSANVRGVAAGIVADPLAPRGDLLPVLADALEDAGCDAGWLPAALRDPLAAPLCCPGWWVLRACVPLPASDPDGQPIT